MNDDEAAALATTLKYTGMCWVCLNNQQMPFEKPQ